MTRKLEVSFNSPQCGWMSIGFDNGEAEFHTTTAHAPHESALAELLRILRSLAHESTAGTTHLLKWNRNPEEFDFEFASSNDRIKLDIYQYPTDERDAGERERVFTHTGERADILDAFAATFEQLYGDRETDEFEFNWRQPFPYREYEEFKREVAAK